MVREGQQIRWPSIQCFSLLVNRTFEEKIYTFLTSASRPDPYRSDLDLLEPIHVD